MNSVEYWTWLNWTELKNFTKKTTEKILKMLFFFLFGWLKIYQSLHLVKFIFRKKKWRKTLKNIEKKKLVDDSTVQGEKQQQPIELISIDWKNGKKFLLLFNCIWTQYCHIPISGVFMCVLCIVYVCFLLWYNFCNGI